MSSFSCLLPRVVALRRSLQPRKREVVPSHTSRWSENPRSWMGRKRKRRRREKLNHEGNYRRRRWRSRQPMSLRRAHRLSERRLDGSHPFFSHGSLPNSRGHVASSECANLLGCIDARRLRCPFRSRGASIARHVEYSGHAAIRPRRPAESRSD